MPSGQRQQTVNLSVFNLRWFESISRHQILVLKESVAGVAQLVECQPSKLDVESSNLFARSTSFLYCETLAQRNDCSRGSEVEHSLGKGEVTGSIPVVSSIPRYVRVTKDLRLTG